MRACWRSVVVHKVASQLLNPAALIAGNASASAAARVIIQPRADDCKPLLGVVATAPIALVNLRSHVSKLRHLVLNEVNKNVSVLRVQATMNYYFEKLFESVHGNMSAQFGGMHVKLVGNASTSFLFLNIALCSSSRATSAPCTWASTNLSWARWVAISDGMLTVRNSAGPWSGNTVSN